MSLSGEQKQVVVSMFFGFVLCISMILSGVFFNPLGFDNSLDLMARMEVVFKSAFLIALCLGVCIGIVARYRFFSKEDINGAVNIGSSEKYVML